MDTYSINPVVVRMKESAKGIVYQSIVALGMRSRQINDQIKNEIQTRLADVITDNDTETTNYDQIAISREFDNMLKPTFLAMREILNDKLSYEFPKVQAAESDE